MAAAGTASLFRNGAFGALVALGQLMGGIGKGVAILCMDDEFIVRFRSAPAGAQARMLHGLQSFGVGLFEGVTGEFHVVSHEHDPTAILRFRSVPGGTQSPACCTACGFWVSASSRASPVRNSDRHHSDKHAHSEWGVPGHSSS